MSKPIFIKVIIAPISKMVCSETLSPICVKANPVREENGTEKNIRVKIYPPFSIPKISTAAAGKVEKWPPSHKNDKAMQMVYKTA